MIAGPIITACPSSIRPSGPPGRPRKPSGAACKTLLVYQAATQHDPAAATGWASTGLLIDGGITPVFALPAVEVWPQRFVPWLAAASPTSSTPVIPAYQSQGDAHRAPGA